MKTPNLHNLYQRWTSVFSRGSRRTSRKTRPTATSAAATAADVLEDRMLLSANVLFNHSGTTFDVQTFGDNIEQALDGDVQGYAYAINQNNVIVDSLADGIAVSNVDTAGPVPFLYTVGTNTEVASVSKNITAVALLNVLEDHAFATVDDSIAPYLPGDWNLGPNVAFITFRNLLTHNSGFGEDYTDPTEVGVNAALAVNVDFNSFNANTYANLQTMAEYGVGNPGDLTSIGNSPYSNANYSLMQILIPRLQGQSPGAGGIGANAYYAAQYEQYVQDNILDPAGVTDGRLSSNSFDARAYLTPATDPLLLTPGVQPGDYSGLGSGTGAAFGWKLSVVDLANYMRHTFNETTSPLEPATLQEMQDGLLGWTGTNGNFGQYRSHGGSFSSGNTGIRTAIAEFPNGVQATVVTNSIPSGLSTASLLISAWESAFSTVAIGGSFGADVFDVDVIGDNLRVQVTTGGVTETFLGAINVLSEVTLVGFNGNDIFNVHALPVGVELVINGGRGSDSLELAPVTDVLNAIDERITFVGGPVFDPGAPTDSINIHDGSSGNSYSYWVTENWFDRTSFDRLNYSRVDEINLWTGGGNDVVRIQSLGADTDLFVDVGSGDDQVIMGNGNLSGNVHGLVDLEFGTGNDFLTLNDTNGATSGDFYVLQENYFQSAVIPVIEWDTGESPENIILLASNHNSTINVRDVPAGVTTSVYGQGGSDTINLHAVSATAFAHLDGGSGSDTIAVTPDDQNLLAIEGIVTVVGGAGAFDRLELHDEQDNSGGRTYRAEDNWFDVMGTPFGRVAYNATMETVEVQAGAGDDSFDVRSTSTPAVVSINGNNGRDTLMVARISQDLDSIDGHLHFSGGNDAGTDAVTLFDGSDFGNDNYTLSTDPGTPITKTGGFSFTHFGVEDVTLNANDFNNTIVIGGAWAIDVVDYTINAGGGADSITVNASAPMHVTVNGGPGAPDRLLVRGTLADDNVTMSGREIQLGDTTVVIGTSLERRTLDTSGGSDLLLMQGMAARNETFLVRASTTPGSGTVQIAPNPSIRFQNLEEVEAQGNAGNNDRLRFFATSSDDSLDINPVADGTAGSPVLHLHDGAGTTLLRLRDFRHVGAPTIRGLDGADTFRVSVFPGSPLAEIRDMRLLAGDPDGTVRGGGDSLIVNFNENMFTQLPGNIGPSNGRIRLRRNSDNEVLDLVYRDFEDLSGNLNLPF